MVSSVNLLCVDFIVSSRPCCNQQVSGPQSSSSPHRAPLPGAAGGKEHRRPAESRGGPRGLRAERPRPLPGAEGTEPSPPESRRLPASSPPSSPRLRYVVGRQPEHHAAAGGAAEGGGGRGEDQGLSGSCRTPAVLYAKCLQRCLACWGSHREQSLP